MLQAGISNIKRQTCRRPVGVKMQKIWGGAIGRSMAATELPAVETEDKNKDNTKACIACIVTATDQKARKNK